MGGTVSSWSVTSKVEVHHIHHILGQLWLPLHYSDVIMSAITSQFTSFTIVYSTIYSGIDQGKHQSSTSLALVRGIHRWPVNSLQKGPVSWKMFPFDKVIMVWAIIIMIFSKPLSVSLRVLTNTVCFIKNGMSCILNSMIGSWFQNIQ